MPCAVHSPDISSREMDLALECRLQPRYEQAIFTTIGKDEIDAFGEPGKENVTKMFAAEEPRQNQKTFDQSNHVQRILTETFIAKRVFGRAERRRHLKARARESRKCG